MDKELKEFLEGQFAALYKRFDALEARQESTANMVSQLISMVPEIKVSVDYVNKRIGRRTHQIADIQESLDLLHRQ